MSMGSYDKAVIGRQLQPAGPSLFVCNRPWAGAVITSWGVTSSLPAGAGGRARLHLQAPDQV